MTLKDYKERIRHAARKVAYYVSGTAIANQRVRAFKRRYQNAAGHPVRRDRMRKKLRFWRIRRAEFEALAQDWRGIKRRRVKQKQRYLKNHPVEPNSNATFDGKDVPPWMVGLAPGPNGTRVNWLQKIRDNGWSGVVVSGVRTPQYSEELCLAMCGAPSCPGRCAGRSSNHNCGDPCKYPGGALDVSDYYRFGAICREIGCPLRNALGPADPVHYSISGV